jgi:hypothetical protein
LFTCIHVLIACVQWLTGNEQRCTVPTFPRNWSGPGWHYWTICKASTVQNSNLGSLLYLFLIYWTDVVT